MTQPVTPASSDAATPLTLSPNEKASSATMRAIHQIIWDHIQWCKDNLGGGVSLAANQIFARASSGVAEGKPSSDLTLSLAALSTAVSKLDAQTAKGAAIASATTTNLAGATGGYVEITGTATIASMGTAAAGVVRVVYFAGALTLTNSVNLICLGGGDVKTSAGDTAVFLSDGSGVWRMVAYHRASGQALSESNATTGILAGGVITAGTGGDDVTVSDGSGTISDYSNPLVPVHTSVSWSSITDVVITDIATTQITYLFINSSAALVQISGSLPTEADYVNNIFLGFVTHLDNATVGHVANMPALGYRAGQDFREFIRPIAPVITSGIELRSDEGGYLVLSGTYYLPGSSHSSTPNTPNLGVFAGVGSASFEFDVVLSDGTENGDAVLYSSGSSDIAPLIWEFPAGSTDILNGNNTAIHRLYFTPWGGFLLAIGQVTYANMDAATQACGSEAFVESALIRSCTMIAKIIVSANGPQSRIVDMRLGEGGNTALGLHASTHAPGGIDPVSMTFTDVPLGSAAVPGLKFTGYNTGVYASATTVGLSVLGTSVLESTASGVHVPGFVSSGAIPATAGNFRSTHQFLTTYRNPTNTGNIDALTGDSAGGLYVGSDANMPTLQFRAASTSYWRIGGVSLVTLNSTGLYVTPVLGLSSYLRFDPEINIRRANVTYLSSDATDLILNKPVSLLGATVLFGENVASPVFAQEDQTGAAHGQDLLIHAQDAMASGYRGGDLILRAGFSLDDEIGELRIQDGYDADMIRVGDGAIAFFGATPVATSTETNTTTGFTANSGTAVLHDSTFTGDTGATAYTTGAIVRRLKFLGLLPA